MSAFGEAVPIMECGALVANLRTRSLGRNLLNGEPRWLGGFLLRSLVPDMGGVMRFTGNYFSEVDVRRGSSNHTLLVPLVACAVGAAASGAVLLYLVGSPITQPGTSSPRAIVRNAGISEPTEIAKKPIVEMPLPPAVTTKVSGRDEPGTQTEAEHQAVVHNQQSRKHSRQRSRERYWQGRFAHAFWSSPRLSSRRDELTSGVR
jgi:hypothetical protein